MAKQRNTIRMTQDELLSLTLYDIPVPEELKIGDRWRWKDPFDNWLVGEFIQPDAVQGKFEIVWSNVQLVNDRFDDQKHIDNLEMLVFRLIRAMKKLVQNHLLVEQATGYMNRQGRSGHEILRALGSVEREESSIVDEECEILPSQCIAGRWYQSPDRGRVLCCGTAAPNHWGIAFACTNQVKQIRLIFPTDSKTYRNCEQTWDD